ncbi:MAG: hypothetical protein LBQ90_03175 [Synergistaceae bacterium]|nr:hypothetical protein [Synergistaceae bacterium]
MTVKRTNVVDPGFNREEAAGRIVENVNNVTLNYSLKALRSLEIENGFVSTLKALGRRTRTMIQTNGLSLSDEWADCLTEFGISAGVSLDGPVFLHDETRNADGTATYNRIAVNVWNSGKRLHLLARGERLAQKCKLRLKDRITVLNTARASLADLLPCTSC